MDRLGLFINFLIKIPVSKQHEYIYELNQLKNLLIYLKKYWIGILEREELIY